MQLDAGRIEVMDDEMAPVYRRKTPAERLAVAHGLWRYARVRLEAAVKWQHPDWDNQPSGRARGQPEAAAWIRLSCSPTNSPMAYKANDRAAGSSRQQFRRNHASSCHWTTLVAELAQWIVLSSIAF